MCTILLYLSKSHKPKEYIEPDSLVLEAEQREGYWNLYDIWTAPKRNTNFTPIQKNPMKKYILYWPHCPQLLHTFYEMNGEITDEKYLESLDCPVTNCVFSYEPKLLESLTEFDLIMFNGQYNIDPDLFPKERIESQIYAIQISE